MVNHWSEKLQSSAAAATSVTATAAAVLGLYPKLVRHTIVEQSRSTLRTKDDDDDDDIDVRSDQKVEVGRYGHLTSRYYYELINDLLRKHEGVVEHEYNDGSDDNDTDYDTEDALARTAFDLDGGTSDSIAHDADDVNSICHTIIALSEDIISLTAAPSILAMDQEQSTDTMALVEADRIRNVTMPYLLDLICVGIELIQYLDPKAFVNLHKKVDDRVKDAVLAATIAAASFTSGYDNTDVCDNSVDSGMICPALKTKLSVSYALRHTLSVPKTNTSVSLVSESTFTACFGFDGIEGNSLLLDEAVVDLSSRSVSSPWSRSMEETQDRKSTVETSADDVLYTILASLCGNEEDDQSTIRSMLAAIVRSLGGQCVSDAVRSHFFGRGLLPSTKSSASRSSTSIMKRSSPNDFIVESRTTIDSVTDSIVARNIASNRLPWPKSSRSKEKSASDRNNATLLPESRAHVTIPSRLCSTIRLCAALANSDKNETGKASKSMLANILPITYCLIDSINATEQTIGGSVMLSLLGHYEVEHWKTFTSAAEDVLGLSIKTGCSDAVALAVLSRARYELELVHQNALDMKDEEEKAGRMRKIVMSLLDVVHKSSYQSGIKGEEEYSERDAQQAFVTSALLGGVHPFLSFLAGMPDEVAASVELVRPGSATLLPFIDWYMPNMQVECRRLQLSALACLEELMVGGHPVVPRHGGKIMSELLGCICRARKSIKHMQKSESGAGTGACNERITAARAVACLGIRVARVALMLCGERAKAVLQMIDSAGDKDGYDPELISLCKEVNAECRIEEAGYDVCG